MMDDKIYELMAQAEILQEHALELQNKTSEAISEIPEAINKLKRKLLSTTILSACIWVILGVLAILVVWFFMKLTTDSLRDERTAMKWEVSDLQGQVEKLRKEVKGEEGKLAEIRAKTLGIELGETKGQRWLRLGKGYEVRKIIEWKDGREGIEINLKK